MRKHVEVPVVRPVKLTAEPVTTIWLPVWVAAVQVAAAALVPLADVERPVVGELPGRIGAAVAVDPDGDGAADRAGVGQRDRAVVDDVAREVEVASVATRGALERERDAGRHVAAE